MRAPRAPWTASVVLSVALIVGGCAASLSAFQPSGDGTPGAGTQLLNDAATATGNPLIIAGVGLVNLLLTAWAASSAKKHATKVANEPLTPEQVRQAKGV